LLDVDPQRLMSDFPAGEISNLAVRLGIEEIIAKALDFECQQSTQTAKESWPWRLALLGATAAHYRNWALAVQLFSESLKLQRRQQDPEAVGQIENGLGIALLESGATAGVFSHFRRALGIGRRLRNRVQIAQSTHNLGEAYRRQGHFKKAVSLLERSLSVSKQLRDVQSEAQTIHSLGLTYLQLGKRTEARRAFNAVRRLGRQAGQVAYEAQGEAGLGDVAYGIRKFGLSKTLYERAAILFEKTGSRHEQAQVLYNLGLVYRNLDQQQEAADAWGHASRIASEGLDWSVASSSYQMLSLLAAEYGTVPQAAAACADALLAGVAALASNNDRELYSRALQNYMEVLLVILKRGTATSDSFMRDTSEYIAKNCPKATGSMIQKNLRQVTNVFKSPRAVRYLASLKAPHGVEAVGPLKSRARGMAAPPLRNVRELAATGMFKGV
jgi:tetratricopeptide (TPR) repeat protein